LAIRETFPAGCLRGSFLTAADYAVWIEASRENLDRVERLDIDGWSHSDFPVQ
tara:strand:+ start:627 stop:785 length:159 start_codon:yes stop_codon:yes gene_type:complete